MRNRSKKKDSHSLQSHLILLACVSLLTTLVVVLGRQPMARDSHPLRPSPLELRRGVSLSIGDQGVARTHSLTTVTPIPLPGDERQRTIVATDFVPLNAPVADPTAHDAPVTRPMLESNLPVELHAAELRWHRVVEGESLQSIALRYLGSEDRAEEIFTLNRNVLSQPDLLPLGAHLQLPVF